MSDDKRSNPSRKPCAKERKSSRNEENRGRATAEEQREPRHDYSKTNHGIDDTRTGIHLMEEPLELRHDNGNSDAAFKHAQAGSYSAGPYAQTKHVDLPSATSWPSVLTVPNSSSIEFDLQGISIASDFAQDQYYSSSPYDHVWQGIDVAGVEGTTSFTIEEQSPQPLQRYLAEPTTRFQQAVMFGVDPGDEDADLREGSAEQ